MYVDTQLVRADYDAATGPRSACASSGRYMDRQEQVEEDIKEVWHLERNLAKRQCPWHIDSVSSSCKHHPSGKHDKGDLRVAFYCRRTHHCGSWNIPRLARSRRIIVISP